ncbi:MAG: transglycosylase SLT domain-containing protein, partial [Persicimonas sp.]
SDLESHDRCRARFRLARTHFRMRDRTAALELYDEIADACTDDASETLRVRSLYGAGSILYGRRKLSGTEKRFQTLLDDYPERTHADDAILFLARVARKQDRDERETELVARSLSEYPEGDMLFEIAWEHLEPLYRDGCHRAFLDRLDELDLPEVDQEYFSQGRLGYFAGQAHRQLGEQDEAAEAWQETWKRYPFSFYGYLSRQRLVEADAEPASLDPGETGGVAEWFDDARWSNSAAARLTRLGLYEMAADAESARLDDEARDDADRWRLAHLEHMAGRHHRSHNLARRAIDDPPWVEPKRGRLVRWHLAWPSPFEAQVRRAVASERRQIERGERLEAALPTAIMREESSFIEDIESWAGALGLMQLMPRTALAHDRDVEGRVTPEQLKEASINVRVGVDHLFSLARRFDSHPALITAAYNAGGGAVSRWLRHHPNEDIALWVEDIPYEETRNYTKRVIGSYAAYQWLSGARDLDDAVADSPG